jgi:hypothetical protein
LWGVSRPPKTTSFASLARLNSKNFRPYATKAPKKTSSYIERLGYGNYEPQRETKLSFVQEEWQFAIFYANTGVMQYIPIVRAGEPERMAALPLGVSPDNGFDMRDPAECFSIAFFRQAPVPRHSSLEPIFAGTLKQLARFQRNRHMPPGADPECVRHALQDWARASADGKNTLPWTRRAGLRLLRATPA